MFKSPASCSCSVLLIALSGTTSTGRATTIRVPEDQPTIQEAIDVAADGDTIDVVPGVYILPYARTMGVNTPCSLVVNKSVTLKARKLYRAVLDGQGDDTTIACIQAATHIKGFVLPLVDYSVCTERAFAGGRTRGLMRFKRGTSAPRRFGREFAGSARYCTGPARG